MWRLIKFLLFTAILIGGVLTLTGYQIDGKTVPQFLRSFLTSKGTGEGVKDIRVMVGEAIKAVGAEISGQEVTDDERKKLDVLVQQELNKEKK